jgi:type II secretion system protein N
MVAAARRGRAAHAASAGGRALAIGLGCALLTAVFFVVRFPVDRFRSALVGPLAAATGAETTIGSLSARPGLGGLTLVGAPVALAWPGGARVVLERVALRPAWSLSWLRGRPALHVDLRAPSGGLAGTLWPDPLAFDGELEDVALATLPPELLVLFEGLALTGELDADVSLARGDAGLAGEVELSVADGSFSAPGSPLAVPFESLEGSLRLGGAGTVEVRSLKLEGPMVSGEATGEIGAAPDLASAPLSLTGELRVTDPGLRSTLPSLGLTPDANGRVPLQLRGTVGAPIAQQP